MYKPSRCSLRRDGFTAHTSDRPRKPCPWRDIAILACPHPLPPPAAGLRPSSVRVRRLLPALACSTAHVSHAAGRIHNLIIIYRLSLKQATISLRSIVAWLPAISNAPCRPLSLRPRPQPVCAHLRLPPDPRPSVHVSHARSHIHRWIIIYRYCI